MARITIVVPCYNEAVRLPARRFVEFTARHAHISFLLVNDGSRDETADVLNRLRSARPGQIRALHLPQNSGKAEAVRQGLLAAAAGGGDYLGYWDADLATPLDQIPRLADVLDRRTEVHAVYGVRLPLLGCRIERRPLRRLLGRAFAAAASITLGQRVCDTQCGAKLFRWGPALEQAFGEPFASRWIFDVELLARLRVVLGHSRQAVVELPLEQWRDVGGSKLRLRDFLRAGGELAQIAWRYRFTRSWQPSETRAADMPNAIPREAGRQRAA